MASVSVEFSAFTDARFKLLGKLTKTDHWGALARVQSLWMQCTERNTSVLKKALIDALMDIDGYASALIESELAEPVDEHSVRIRGTEGRIEWLASARERQKVATAAARVKRTEKTKKSKVGSKIGTYLGSNNGSEVGSNSLAPLVSSSASTSSSASVPASAPSQKTKQESVFEKKSSEDLRDQTKKAIEAWHRCLEFHKANRNPLPGEDSTIAFMIQRFGIDAVLMSILGAQYEPASEDFKPSRHLSLKRIFDPQKFERFVNLGAQVKNQLASKRITQEKEQKKFETPSVEEECDPERVRAIIASAFNPKSKESA